MGRFFHRPPVVQQRSLSRDLTTPGMPDSTTRRNSQPVRPSGPLSAPQGTALSALALLPRDSLERAARHVGLVLGSPTSLLGDGPAGADGGAAPVRVALLPTAPSGAAVFRDDVGETPGEDALPAVRSALGAGVSLSTDLHDWDGENGHHRTDDDRRAPHHARADLDVGGD